jgi:hypothetical protein
MEENNAGAPTRIFTCKGAQPQSKLNADRISALEPKIGQQTMEIDF